MQNAWQRSLDIIKNEITPQEWATWLSVLHLIFDEQAQKWMIVAPNQFFLDKFQNTYQQRIFELLKEASGQDNNIIITTYQNNLQTTNTKQTKENISKQEGKEGKAVKLEPEKLNNNFKQEARQNTNTSKTTLNAKRYLNLSNNLQKSFGGLNRKFSFDNFVEGNSNRFALAAAKSAAQNPQDSHNPLVIYGGTGLGKTHLMHSIGNFWFDNNVDANIIFVKSQQFVQEMVNASRTGTIDDFQNKYRNVDALLIDDIQFFAGKNKSQEEFFHIFNNLIEVGQPVILTSDRHPKEISDLNERLKSRLSWGLTILVEPPDLETRIAILEKKAIDWKVNINKEALIFLAQKVRANVRELEGAFKKVREYSHFLSKEIVDIDLINESLQDLFAINDKQITVNNIQKVVAEYFEVDVDEIISKSRARKFTRPRQFAMAIARDLTENSIAAIGKEFGKRDHTTVLHSCKKIDELRQSSMQAAQDYNNLIRILTV